MSRAFLLAACIAGSAIAQSSTLPPSPVGSAAAPSQPGAAAAAADAEAKAKTQKSGAGRTSNRKPLDIRLHEGGVKLPKCATESREGEACKN
jgi:hypothetical protein